ncbi:MAG: anaerobic glycerol-3-phosphate dehydrogenase subunit C [Firmicutes bacterium]|nr:anaerobic glycerol-3-phosphate dehydrogenase subunit C [Bacillota bacterium]
MATIQDSETERDPRLTSDQCIKCQICTAYCPVARVTDRFPGPKFAGPDSQRLRFLPEPVLDLSVDFCINCKTCNLVCPSGVKPSDLNTLARANYVAARGQVPRNWLLGHAELLGRLGSAAAPLTNLVLRDRLVKAIMEKVMGISKERTFPAYARRTFARRFAGRKRGRLHGAGGDSVPSRPRQAAKARKVAYFAGCFANYNDLELGMAVVEVLEHNGCEVVVPPQVCCGLPLIANGEMAAARKNGEFNIKSLGKFAAAGYDIVFSSTSCGLTVRSDYQNLLGLEGAERIAARAYDISEYLLLLHDEGRLDLAFEPGESPLRLAYHAPCHLKAHGVGYPAVKLLQLIPGVEVTDLGKICCGIGGTYGFKKEKYQISMDIGQELFEAIRNSGVPLVASDCETCRIQIEHGVPEVHAVHPAILLREAYRRAEARGRANGRSAERYSQDKDK